MASMKMIDVRRGMVLNMNNQLWYCLDRDLNKNFRVGVGYNFTDFSDDLTDFDYDHKGWFLNLVGNY